MRELAVVARVLGLENRERVRNHSWLSKARSRFPHEVHEMVFGWVSKLVVAVGTRIAPRLPHRSRRALLTHRAHRLGRTSER